MSEHTASEDDDPLRCRAVIALTYDSPSDELLPPSTFTHELKPFQQLHCTTTHATHAKSANLLLLKLIYSQILVW